MEDTKTFGEQIKEKITKTRMVSFSFPINVLERFQIFAKENANDCYWLAIQYLLDKSDIGIQLDAKTVLLMNSDENLQEQINRQGEQILAVYKILDDMTIKSNNENREEILKKKYYGRKEE